MVYTTGSSTEEPVIVLRSFIVSDLNPGGSLCTYVYVYTSTYIYNALGYSCDLSEQIPERIHKDFSQGQYNFPLSILRQLCDS